MENTTINPRNELTALPKRNLPRDVFLHLLAIVTLYWSAVSFITLCWQYINYFFPDVLYYNYGYNGFAGPIRFAIASLAVVFPVFLLVSWFLNKIYAKESAVRESKIRKWLIYLTLFIAALVIIGDLVYVKNTFLAGEITVRFLLKALWVVIVAGIIFGYYLDDVRRSVPSPLAKWFAGVCAFLIAAGIIGAFFIVGSPANARLAQFDQQRVNDLQNIQYQVVNYWQRKNELPSDLVDLNDSISGYVTPQDPKTNISYEYHVKNATNLQFELCAVFDLESNNINNLKTTPKPVMYRDETSQNWNHASGRVCFERTIDQKFYPPLDKGK